MARTLAEKRLGPVVTGVEIRVELRFFLAACGAGLNEKTALVDLSVSGPFVRDPLWDNHFRENAAALYPAEPLYGVSDWPTDFLLAQDTPGPADGDDLWWLGEWVVALTVAIQRWGRDPVWRGRVRSVEPGRLKLAIPWTGWDFFDEALTLALRIIADWMTSDDGGDRRTLDSYFDGRLPGIQNDGLGPMTLRFIEAAVRRGMPFDVLPSYVQIGWGANAERFDWALTGHTSWMAMGIAKNKNKASSLLAVAGLPVARAAAVSDLNHALQVADEFGWPVVVKPRNLDGGVGVQVGIGDVARLTRAFEHADQVSSGDVIMEQHCPGDDHRILVVRGTVLQVVRRKPAQVVGDGVRTVGQLVDLLNSDPRRGTSEDSLLKVVSLDADAVEYLAEQGFGPDSVPAEGQSVRLARISNIGAGGTAEDVTAVAHPDNVALAVRAARIVGLDIAGIDILCPDISRSWREVGGVICEVNGQPGFRPHWLSIPDRDINGEVLDIVFDGRPSRIPTAAITGTNGKTTTTEMLARIWTTAGKLTGVCTTNRVRIGDQTVSTDNLSGQPGARIVLDDPAVEAAVLEMPRKGLIYFGHQCDRYDVGAFLNLQDDHVGVEGIDTLEQLAELKAEVLQRATQAIVVNAEDPLCLAMRSRAGTDRHILVARTPRAEAVVEHRRQGGEAVFIDERHGRPWIVLATGESETDLMPVHDIPATMNGLLVFNETNALFAAALAWAQGIDYEIIRRALGTFCNSPEHNPGRFNFIDGLPFTLLLDFAHNPDGVRELCSVIADLPVSGRRVLGSVKIGNRHGSHIDAVAALLADSFDEFVVGCEVASVLECPDYAGSDPVGAMLARFRTRLMEQGVEESRISCDADEQTAVLAALDRGRPGDLVVLLVADFPETLQTIERWLRGRKGLS